MNARACRGRYGYGPYAAYMTGEGIMKDGSSRPAGLRSALLGDVAVANHVIGFPLD